MKHRKKILTAITSISLLTFSSCSSPSNNTKPKLIEIMATGMKKEFEIGESFSSDNIKVIFKYDNLTTKIATPSQYVIDYSKYNELIPQTYPIYIYSNDDTKDVFYEYNVTVRSKYIEYNRIEVTKYQELYYLNDSFNCNSIEVTAYSENGYSKILSKDEFVVDYSSINSKIEGDYYFSISTNNGLTTHKQIKVRKDYSKRLKILTIGNSFSDDATEYLYTIAKGYSIENIVIGNLYVGGCTISQHRTFAQNDQSAYVYRKNTSGYFDSKDGYTLKNALEDEDWDIITLQQGSVESGLASTYNTDIDFLVNYIKDNTISPYKLGWHMTWAYQQNSSHYAFSNYDSNQRTMYESIINAVKKKIITNDNFKFIVANGTAIQNARTSSLGDNLTRDGHHLSLDNGRFIAGLNFICSITGYNPNDLDISYFPGNTATNELIIRESVNNAIKHPFSVCNSEYSNLISFKEEDYIELPVKTKLGYYDASSILNFSEIIPNSKENNFGCIDKIFSKDTLISGAIIKLTRGYRYKTINWVDLETPNPYKNHYVLDEIVKIDENWWKEYHFCSFNFSSLTKKELSEDEINSIMKIYLPKPVDIKE